MFDMLRSAEQVAREATLVARLAELEHRKSAAAAEQARLTAEFDEIRRADEAARGVPARRRGKGLASEVALARRDSPNRGARHLGFARALVYEMPWTLAALEAGMLSEWRATILVRESACLDGQTDVVNGRGSCAACNYAKQAPGWKVHTAVDETGVHTAEFVTPTGAVHHSQAPPLPGPPPTPWRLIDVARFTIAA